MARLLLALHFRVVSHVSGCVEFTFSLAWLTSAYLAIACKLRFDGVRFLWHRQIRVCIEGVVAVAYLFMSDGKLVRIIVSGAKFALQERLVFVGLHLCGTWWVRGDHRLAPHERGQQQIAEQIVDAPQFRGETVQWSLVKLGGLSVWSVSLSSRLIELSWPTNSDAVASGSGICAAGGAGLQLFGLRDMCWTSNAPRKLSRGLCTASPRTRTMETADASSISRLVSSPRGEIFED